VDIRRRIREHPRFQAVTRRVVRVGVLGAGAWARQAHLPGYRRDPAAPSSRSPICRSIWRVEPRASSTFLTRRARRDLLERDDIDLIDVCKLSQHVPRVVAALESGKHVLCEKPVAHDFAHAARARLARRKGLKTKVGLMFRYSPAMRCMRELVATGFIGTPFIFNGYEQNSQWLDPATPLRQVDLMPIRRSSGVVARGYGAPIIDLPTRWWAAISRRSSARCATSFPTGWCAPRAA
jgi:predicted dehydrogenase